ncbi:MAG TPA: histidine--tRNA ligase [Candidatus Nanoarchaeia archaeon]|nr:histidine--tRNA ligase [Candidatus Nanoarchaeia archaeon]
MILKNAKGTRDFLPKEKIVRDSITKQIKEVFELYGYSPLETPALESYEVLSAKYAGGSEILKETFKLKDQGKRDLALRYDLTVPFARVIGMNPNIKMPFKRYQIDKVWRDGPIKLGRYREFWQCDVDVVGCKEMIADAELLKLSKEIFKKLELDIIIKVNNRKLMNGILDYCKVKEKDDVILIIDKLDKIGNEEVRKELKKLKVKEIDKLMDILLLENGMLNELSKIDEAKEGLKEINELLEYCKAFDVDVKLDLSLARGLSYYTGTVFEVYLVNNKIKSSVAAGGRYDNMIGNFIGNGSYPAVGISFGLDVINDALALEGRNSIVKIYVIPIGKSLEAVKILNYLRENEIKTDIDVNKRGISKNLDYANSYKIPYVLFVGERELKEGKFKLRNMENGFEEMMTKEDVVKRLK